MVHLVVIYLICAALWNLAAGVGLLAFAAFALVYFIMRQLLEKKPNVQFHTPRRGQKGKK
jgi:hypothetical protein